jgi:hypothetical protein
MWIFNAQDYPALTTGTTPISSESEANRTSHATFFSLDPVPHFPVQLLHCSLLARIAAKVPDLKGFRPNVNATYFTIYMKVLLHKLLKFVKKVYKKLKFIRKVFYIF